MSAADDDVAGPFHPASIAARVPAGGGLTLLSIDAPESVTATYRSPGQYIEVRAVDDRETGPNATGFFVLASEPGARPWELIMRSGGGASDVLLVAPVGTPIEVTAAIGCGFPLDDARGLPLVVVLGGTGIAAGRPIVRARIRDGDAVRTDVLIGVRSRAELALEGDLREWSAAGARVTVCVSQPDGELECVTPFAAGYVQDALRGLGARPGLKTRVFAVGPEPMVAALREVAPEIGILRSDVLTNH
jgi:NAD(P)H-flavin reductase